MRPRCALIRKRLVDGVEGFGDKVLVEDMGTRRVHPGREGDQGSPFGVTHRSKFSSTRLDRHWQQDEATNPGAHTTVRAQTLVVRRLNSEVG